MHQRDRRHISRLQSLQLLQQWHTQYGAHCTVVDVAVADGANAAFSHWQLELWNKETEEATLVEGGQGRGGGLNAIHGCRLVRWLLSQFTRSLLDGVAALAAATVTRACYMSWSQVAQ
jgi:hypothetical protein